MSQKITIVLPCYNEEKVIKKVIEDYIQVIKKESNIDLLVTEDGSTDNTRAIIFELKDKYGFDFITSNERKGYLKALQDSLLVAAKKSKWVFYCDTDNTLDPLDFFKLKQYLSEYEIIGGWRSPRSDSFFRKFISKMYHRRIKKKFKFRLRDTNIGFKFVRSDVVLEIVPKIKHLKYGFSTELVLRALNKNYSYVEIPINHKERKTGEATQINLKTILKVIKQMNDGLTNLQNELNYNKK